MTPPSGSRADGSREEPRAEGPLSGRYRLITLGTVVLVFVAAFENLAVTTVMPVISTELHGEALYAVAFAAPLAVSVVGMVAAGQWCDRSGPRVPLSASVALFIAGLVVAGLASTMEQVVVGRLVQGLGSGGVTVTLYVIVARVFSGALQPRVFGLMSAAWVVPALVGPLIAGVLGETVGWRWVFLGVALICVPALGLLLPVLRSLAAAQTGSAPGFVVSRLVCSVLLAVGILALSISAEFGGMLAVAVAAGSVLLAALAVRPLLPRGTLTGRPGLPRIVLTRFVLAGGFFATETYLPFLLTHEYAYSPAQAGLALSVSGVAWGAASLLQGRYAARLADRWMLAAGTSLVALAVAVALATALLGLPGWVAVAGWALSGTGMGLAYPRLSVLLLARSSHADQGFNSSALNIADAAGPAVALSIAGLAFQALPGVGVDGFAAVFGLGLALAVGAVGLSRGVAGAGVGVARGAVRAS
ncbi:MFS transporter [Herbiconiux gentiana]|uniref:MFS transporter n=1 Tax=Herbiconiux gentiana TaxID=2970912 RepID=UPI0022B99222|nr:MFS transporter [Herbiconiux gentiana]